VALRRARSIDRLHSLVADHDLVLTSDAPLALALNRRTPEARLGELVQTPRGYAKQGLEVADRRELFHEVVTRTGLSFKQAARGLDQALRCWEETGEAERVVDHARDPEAVAGLVDVVTDLESAHTLREDVTIPDSVDLAVVDPGSLSALDRAILPDPDSYATIDPFAPAGRFELGEIDLLPSTVAIADTLEAHITPENAGDVGIVLDPAGPVRPLVEATLEARSIPYHTEEGLAEHPGLRSFLRVLRTGLTRRRLRAGDVRGLLAQLGLGARRRDDEKLLAEVDDRRLEGLTDLWANLDEATLGEALDAFAEVTETPRELGELVAELELGEAPVTSALLDALEYYLETFPVERDYSREGVLLASGADNAYVDRPLVFHVGLGTGWAKSLPEEPWSTPETRRRRERQDLARFERLLQSGRRRVYLAQDTRRGEPLTPCFHLHELLEADVERFADLPHRERRPPPREQPVHDGFAADEELVDVDPDPPATLSSGDLDRLTYCPRDWFMDQLVPTTETVWLRRGRLFHAFAELAVERPDLVDPTDAELFDELVDVALDELDELLDPDERAPAATELRVGLQAIARWLHANPPEDPVPAYENPPPDRRQANPFAEHLDVELARERAERWFQDHDVGVHGMVDLLHAPDRLVDWKSTRSPDTLPGTVRRTRVDGSDEPPRFQPGVYLLHHREVRPDEALEFALVDLLSERNAAIRGEAELDSITRRLPYRPCSFEEHLASAEAYEYATQSRKRREDVFAEVGYGAYRAYVEQAEIPELSSKDEALATPFAEGLVDLARRERGDLAKSEKAARGAVKRLVRLKQRTLYAEDLDRLAGHVQATLEGVDAWRGSRFPVPEDVDGDELAHRELVLRDLASHRSRAAREARDG
jgi:hypothetical protein